MRRLLPGTPALLLFIACGGGGGGSGSTGPTADAGTTPPVADAGAPADDGGTGIIPPDAGSPAPDGGTADAGPVGGGPGPTPDAGTPPPDECAGLTPAAAGASVQLQIGNIDLDTQGCQATDVDGTSHVSAFFTSANQVTNYTFFEAATGVAAGTFQGSSLNLIGQASGFIGGECFGANCDQDYVVLGPTGQQLFKSAVTASTPVNVNNPTGGMIHTRITSGTAGGVLLIDSIDATGAIRWTQPLPDQFTGGIEVVPGVDRQGNLLVLWNLSNPFDATAWSGRWFDPAGNAGPVFAFTGGRPIDLEDRVGSGLFVLGGISGSSNTVWIGQVDSMATTIGPPPSWLVSRPNTTLHMVHGGTGYAVLPDFSFTQGPCQSQIEVIAPSGNSCGAATFPIAGGTCSGSRILVGFDGTVVQQTPAALESCTAGGHVCTCTWHSWPGFFR
jgi:hypothetical protein